MRWNFRNKKIEEKSNTEKKPSFKNPLFNKQNSLKVFLINQKKIVGLIFLLISILILFLLYYSSIFKISEIELVGFNKISAKTISKELLGTQLNSYRYIIFRQDNLLVFNKEEFIKKISKDYSLDSISIKKRFSKKLLITIQEKKPLLIYNTNNQKFYLDENGVISSHIIKEGGSENITVISNDANEEASANEIIFSSNKIQFILSVVEKLKKINKITVISYSIPNKLSFQLNVLVEQGFSIYFDMNKNIDEQISKLRRVLNESESGESPTDYIDLRIGEKVYIK